MKIYSHKHYWIKWLYDNYSNWFIDCFSDEEFDIKLYERKYNEYISLNDNFPSYFSINEHYNEINNPNQIHFHQILEEYQNNNGFAFDIYSKYVAQLQKIDPNISGIATISYRNYRIFYKNQSHRDIVLYTF